MVRVKPNPPGVDQIMIALNTMLVNLAGELDVPVSNVVFIAQNMVELGCEKESLEGKLRDIIEIIQDEHYIPMEKLECYM